jgi:hypothetical protein
LNTSLNIREINISIYHPGKRFSIPLAAEGAAMTLFSLIFSPPSHLAWKGELNGLFLAISVTDLNILEPKEINNMHLRCIIYHFGRVKRLKVGQFAEYFNKTFPDLPLSV